MHLISHQPRGRLHSQLESGESSLADRRNGREQLRLNPGDAQARGIRDGDTVRLWNTRGACLATASVSRDNAQGVAVLPTGAWFTAAADGTEISGNPNVLTLDIPSSAFGQGCAAHTCLIRVAPHAGDNRDPMLTYQTQLAEMLSEPEETS